MTQAIEYEGWKPFFITPADIAYIFMEPFYRKVRNNRVVACNLTFVGPDLTAEMVKANRGNLAGLDGQKIEVRIDPDNPEAGAFAIDPRSKEPIYLAPETRINPFDDAQVESALAQKKRNIKAVTDAFKLQTEEIKKTGRVLSVSTYKELDESKKATQKAIEDTVTAPDFSQEELANAVQELLKKEQNDHAPKVYANERDRYDAIVVALVSGATITQANQEFKIYFEKKMPEDMQIYFENKIKLLQQKNAEVKKWN